MANTDIELMPYLQFSGDCEEAQFWGDWHGNFTDRFGIRWMVNCSNIPADEKK
ncbi:MAG TPA: hypothetical protein VII44_06460 [Puia sp.]